MAEGIARANHSELATYGSAGTMAVRGSAPTDPATCVVGELGIDIGNLRATSLRRALTPIPDRIYVMTERHRAKVAAGHSDLADRVELLDPAGEIADPYGLDEEFYRKTRDKIVAAIDLRAEEWRKGQE